MNAIKVMNSLNIAKSSINQLIIITCVRPLVNLQIFWSCEYFATTRERAGERFLSGVHANVIN